MNLTAPSEVAALLRRHGLRPRKRWGQNFLIDRNTLDNVLRAADLSPEDQVLEIGPGLGTLTRELASRARRVVAVEIDPLLVGILRSETVADVPNLELVHGDALELHLAALLDEGAWKVAANIPYYITTPLIERLLSVKERLERIVLMVQREVAARLTAAPGSDDYSALSVYVQYHTEPALTARVSRGAFLPPPDVDSAIVCLRIRRQPPVTVHDEARLFQVVRAAFQQRRKTLLNALTTLPNCSKEVSHAALQRAGIDPKRRGETLSLPEFARLADELAAPVPDPD